MSEKIGAAPTGHPNDSAARRTHWRGAARPNDKDEKHTNGLLGSIPYSHTERDIEGELANALLIAAAPELLESCKNLLTLTQLIANETYNNETMVELGVFNETNKHARRLALADELAKARAAIAKATGAESSVAQPVEGGEV